MKTTIVGRHRAAAAKTRQFLTAWSGSDQSRRTASGFEQSRRAEPGSSRSRFAVFAGALIGSVQTATRPAQAALMSAAYRPTHNRIFVS